VPKRTNRTNLTRARRTLTAGAVACVVAGSALAVPASASTSSTSGAASPVATQSPTASQSARWGAGWLARQITANGGHLTAFGAADVPDTAYAVVGLHAAGVGRAAGAQAITYLKTQLGVALKASDGTDSPGTLGYFILAAVAAGSDPRHFGGTGKANDLVARLLATGRTTGSDAGLFGSADPTFDGAFRQGVALAALKAAGLPASNTTVKAGIGWLTGQQCADGTWTSYRSDTSIACPAVDPSTFTGPDTNSTGMAVQGLAAYGLRPGRSHLLGTLHSIQSADGGFGFLAAAGQPSDPNSTALVVQAILAEGGNPGTLWWAPTGTNPYAALVSFQLGCTDAAGDRGAFFFPGSRTANVFATVQVVPALARRTLPVAPSTLGAQVPMQSCSTPAVQRAAAAAVLRAPTRAGVAGPCPGKTGVTVAVDFTAFGKAMEVRCAPGHPATGIAALKQAGFPVTGTAQFGLAFVCRIKGLPTKAAQACITTPPVNAFWAYYHALAGATTWSFSSQGASSYQPPQGSIDAWAFGASAQPGKSPAQVRAGG
jgi:hypothetical protein